MWLPLSIGAGASPARPGLPDLEGGLRLREPWLEDLRLSELGDLLEGLLDLDETCRLKLSTTPDFLPSSSWELPEEGLLLPCPGERHLSPCLAPRPVDDCREDVLRSLGD